MELETIKERVYWIYQNYQDAVNFNCVLNAVYQNYFGKVNTTASIERAGRYWRSTCPHIFSRNINIIEHNVKHQKEIIEVFKNE